MKGRVNENIRKKIGRSTGTRDPECKSSHGNRKVPKKLYFTAIVLSNTMKLKRKI